MVDSKIREALLKQLDALPPELQRRVLAFAHALSGPAPGGTPAGHLARFAGTLPAEDATAMAAAIEAGCEHIDRDGW